MPAIKWEIEPVFVSRGSSLTLKERRTAVVDCRVDHLNQNQLVNNTSVDISDDDNQLDLEIGTQTTLVSLIRQLSCLALIADKILDEIKTECQEMCQRTARLGTKMSNVSKIVEQLNPKEVKVPVGDLNRFMELRNHFSSNKDNSMISTTSNLLTLSSRTRYIKDAYERIPLMPVNNIKPIHYYDNGKCESTTNGIQILSSCQSILKEVNRANLMEIELNKPSNLAQVDRLPKSVILKRARTPIYARSKHQGTQVDKSSCEEVNEDGFLDRTGHHKDDNWTTSGTPSSSVDNLSEYRLPTTKEQTEALATEFGPSTYVPIDVTGISFQRMSSFRRSLIHGDVVFRRKTCRNKENQIRRRNTICEIGTSTTYQNQSSSTDSILGNKDGRKSKVRRRSSLVVGFDSSLNPSIEKIDHGVQTENSEADIYSSGRILNLTNGSTQVHRNPSSGSKIEFKAEVHCRGEEANCCHHRVQNNRNSLPGEAPPETRADDVRNSLILKNGSVYVPLVKMRETIAHKVAGDDGRSSSGNWSGSSSTHASCDSENLIASNGVGGSNLCKLEHPLTRSNSSIGKDSVISDSNHGATGSLIIGNGGAPSSPNGYYSDISGMSTSFTTDKTITETKNNNQDGQVTIRHHDGKPTVRFANRDSESWLQYFDQDSSETVTPTRTTPGHSEAGQSDTGTITPSKQVSPNGYEKKRLSIHDLEDVESVYSVDNDGYYTSMHSDSGLFFRERPGIKLMITPNSSFRCKGGKRDSISSVSTIGDISINSVLSKTETEVGCSDSLDTSNATIASLIRPCPPQRKSSLRKDSLASSGSGSGSGSGSTSTGVRTPLVDVDNRSTSRSMSRSPLNMMSPESEISERLRRQRLQEKTCIDATRYPSLCAAVTTSEGSDEDGTSAGGGSSTSGSSTSVGASDTKKSKSKDSYKRFSIKDIFGSLSSLSKTMSKSKEALTKKIRRNNGNKKVESPSTKSSKQVPDKPRTKKDSTKANQCSTSDSRRNEATVASQSSSSTTTPKNRSPSASDSESSRLTSECSSPPSIPPPLRVPSLLRKGFLDKNDKIIFSSNSLGRRRDGHPLNYLDRTSSVKAEQKRSAISVPDVDKVPLTSSPTKYSSKLMTTSNSLFTRSGTATTTTTTAAAGGRFSSLLNGSIPAPVRYQPVKFPPSLNLPNPSQLKTSLSSLTSTFKSTPTTNSQTEPQIATPKAYSGPNSFESAARRLFNISTNKPTNPTPPISSSILTNETKSPSNGAVINQVLDSSRPETKSTVNGVPIDVFNNKKRSNLSTEDLLVLIHNSKKRMNIREKSTSPETSLSPTPGCLNSNNNSNQIDNGSLRNTAGTRQSWAGTPLSRPNSAASTSSLTTNSAGTPRSRVSLAIDRLGPIKATPINEFKKLLSQARPSNGSTQGKSALELLKATSPLNGNRPQTPVVSCSTSFLGSNSSGNGGSNPGNSKTSTTPASSATRTRVINGRFYRSPYRLEAMYPPIEEANSEENLLAENESKSTPPSFSSLQNHNGDNPDVNKHNAQAFVGTTSTWV